MDLPQRYSGRQIDLGQASALFLEDADEIDRVVNFAVRQALLEHKRAGNSVAGWKDRQVVIVRPEDIPE